MKCVSVYALMNCVSLTRPRNGRLVFGEKEDTFDTIANIITIIIPLMKIINLKSKRIFILSFLIIFMIFLVKTLSEGYSEEGLEKSIIMDGFQDENVVENNGLLDARNGGGPWESSALLKGAGKGAKLDKRPAKSAAKSAGNSAGNSLVHSPERSPQRSPERSPQRSPERSADRSPERSADRSAETNDFSLKTSKESSNIPKAHDDDDASKYPDINLEKLSESAESAESESESAADAAVVGEDEEEEEGLRQTMSKESPNTQNVATGNTDTKSNAKFTKPIHLQTISSNHSLQAQKAFFKNFSRNGVVTIVQANSGYIDILSNMFCTLLATNPEYLKGTLLVSPKSNSKGLVVWTTDASFSSAWRTHTQKVRLFSPSSALFMSEFGIYYQAVPKPRDSSDSISKDTNSTNNTAYSKKVGSGSKEYYQLMNLRGSFFVHLLEQVQTEFLFLDADMVFFRDPFPWITANQGLGIGGGKETSVQDLSFVIGICRQEYRLKCIIGQKSIGLNLKKWKGKKITERELSLRNYFGFKGDYKYMGPNNPEWAKSYTPTLDREEQLLKRLNDISKYYQPEKNMDLKTIADQDPFLYMAPDLVYGIDPLDAPEYNPNPFKGTEETYLYNVPKICGGTFYVKPNNRTVMLFKKLLQEIEQGGNDQWSMDVLLNRLDTVLVGQLPRCTARTGRGVAFCPEKLYNKPDSPSNLPPFPPNESTLRVRVLEYWQFCTGAVYYSDSQYHRQEKAFMYHRLIKGADLSYLKEQSPFVPFKVAVAYHGNTWGRDKITSMKAAGVWYLDTKGTCSFFS